MPIQIGDKQFDVVNVADSPESWARGLSGRAGLQEGTGMLFVYPAPYIQQIFWMKGMLFPIDVIFIGENDSVVDIARNLPKAELGKEPVRVQSSKPVKMALEVSANDSQGISVGDMCDFL